MPRSCTAFVTIEAGALWRRLHVRQVAELLQISHCTAARWFRKSQTPDPARWKLLEILALGAFPWVGWRGFYVDPQSGRLETPNGYSLTAGELEHYGMVCQERRLLYRDLSRARTALEEAQAYADRLRARLREIDVCDRGVRGNRGAPSNHAVSSGSGTGARVGRTGARQVNRGGAGGARTGASGAAAPRSPR
mgnify:FL=1